MDNQTIEPQNLQSPTPDVPITPSPTAIPPAGSPISPLNKPKNNKKIIIVIIVILLLAISGVAGALILKKDTNQPDTKKGISKNDSTKKDATNISNNNTNTDDSKYANCLRPKDFNSIWDLDTDYYNKEIEASLHSEAFFFLPDSLSYSKPESEAELLDELAKFHEKFHGKFWTLTLQGQIKDVDGSGGSEANKKFANDRADKVKQELINKGFEASEIEILEPEIFDASLGTDDSDRNVSLLIESQCKPDKTE